MTNQMDVAPWCYKWDLIGWISQGGGTYGAHYGASDEYFYIFDFGIQCILFDCLLGNFPVPEVFKKVQLQLCQPFRSTLGDPCGGIPSNGLLYKTRLSPGKG